MKEPHSATDLAIDRMIWLKTLRGNLQYRRRKSQVRARKQEIKVKMKSTSVNQLSALTNLRTSSISTLSSSF